MPLNLKHIVSGKRIRTKQHGFDLDITNITDRILAMSFPADDWKEKTYRNNITEVSQFLDQSHPGHKYWIYNLSNRKVATKHFHERVIAYNWEDHHSPSLLVLFECCSHVYDFLE